MRRTCITTAIVATIILVPFMIGASCAQNGGLLGTDAASPLSAAQKQALVAAVKAAESIAQGSQILGYSSHLATARSKHDDARLISTCPTITLTGNQGCDATLTIDFGQQPCTVPFTYQTSGTTYACSGSATGTANLTTHALNLTFNSLSCNGETIDGTLDATTNSDSGLSVTGSWNLAYTSPESGYSCSAAGSGVGVYYWVQDCCDATVVSWFNGALSSTQDDATTSWTVLMNNIQISAEQYGSLVPYSGSVVVSGANISSVTIAFNENSPTTGEVTIMISNASGSDVQTFTVNLFTLAEWLAATPGTST